MEKFPKITLIIVFIAFLTTGCSPVFALKMESNSYKLDLEPSDIKSISQAFKGNNQSILSAGSDSRESSPVFSWKIAIASLFSLILIILIMRKVKMSKKI